MFNGSRLASAFRHAVSHSKMSKPPSDIRKLATLPRLPVPPLKETLSKYLLSVQALLKPQEYEETEKVVKAFGHPGGVGHRLHQLLQERAQCQVNWLSDWWLKSAYLEFREPVVAYSSPGLVMPEQKFNSSEDQLKFASQLVIANLKFKSLIDNNQLPLEKSGGAPLDMSQYRNIFGTCRVPKANCDELKLNPNSKHVVVAHNNNYFKLNVYNQDGTPLNENQVFAQLKSIVECSKSETVPVGILSTEHRDTWAASYKRLSGLSSNNASIDEIQKSLFLVCLDKQTPKHDKQNYFTRSALTCIHGGGISQNSGNRWYDKTIQFIISTDGMVGLTYEHSPAEGPPITSLVDYIMLYIEKNTSYNWAPLPTAEQAKLLEFQTSPEIQVDIEDASRDLDVLIKDLDMSCFTFGHFGKDFIKGKKMSPDSVIQMALQLAFFRLNGCLGATYESASTRMFDLGRTETIRSASLEALTFCQAMKGQPTEAASEKVNALRQAVASHKAYTVSANSGLGVDRLLLGLKRIAVENGMNVPDLYLDAGYTISSHFRLSTSQVPSRCNAVMGYGPVVPDGYGCCYNPQPQSINIAASAWNSSPTTDAKKFTGAVEQGLVDIHDVLVAAQSSKL